MIYGFVEISISTWVWISIGIPIGIGFRFGFGFGFGLPTPLIAYQLGERAELFSRHKLHSLSGIIWGLRIQTLDI